jgi:putative copper export protein
MRALLVMIHVLAATVWTGGHLVLALRFLPAALRTRDPALITLFESRFEPIGLPALLLQVITGFWLATYRFAASGHWPGLDTATGQLLDIKIALLVLTVALALHARLRLIPGLDAARLRALAWHIGTVTVTAVLFVLAGVGLRFQDE